MTAGEGWTKDDDLSGRVADIERLVGEGGLLAYYSVAEALGRHDHFLGDLVAMDKTLPQLLEDLVGRVNELESQISDLEGEIARLREA